MTLRMFDADNEWVVRIHAHVHEHAASRRRVAAHPDPRQAPTSLMLADMLEVAFWASLITNEGRPTRVRMALVPVGSDDQVTAFKHPLPFTEEEMARLAPAAWSTGWLAVDVLRQPPCIWGINKNSTHETAGLVTIEVSDPGVIRVGYGQLQSFVVFAGRATAAPHGTRDLTLAARLRSALGKDASLNGAPETSTAWRECMALSLLARLVLEDRHGGTLLVVPTGDARWRNSLQPFTHEFKEADTSIRDAIAAVQHRQMASLATPNPAELPENIRDAVYAALSHVNWHPEGVLRPVARLAAIDGAVVLTSNLSVLGFGAMISVSAVPDVYVAEPATERTYRMPIEEAGGTRHQSAIRFAGANPEAVALVISHDSHLSVAHWSAELAGVLLLKNAEWWI
jgi:Probable sensor domain DACNV